MMIEPTSHPGFRVRFKRATNDNLSKNDSRFGSPHPVPLPEGEGTLRYCRVQHLKQKTGDDICRSERRTFPLREKNMEGGECHTTGLHPNLKRTVIRLYLSRYWVTSRQQTISPEQTSNHRIPEHTKPMATAKHVLRSILDSLPEDATYEELLRELAFEAMIERGLEDVRHGHTITDSELKERLRTWQN